MAVTHILMYRFKKGVPDSRIDEHLATIAAFEGTPGLQDLAYGRNVCTWNDDFTHGFIMTFDSMESLDAYNASQQHDELVRDFKEQVERRVGFDLPR